MPSETCSCRSRPSLDADHLLTCEYWNRKSCTPFARTSRSVSPTSRIHSTPGWFGFNRTSGNETFWNGAGGGGGGGDCCEEAEAGKKPPAPAPPNPDDDDDDITLTKQRRCALKSELSLSSSRNCEAHLKKAWSLKLSEGVLKDNKSCRSLSTKYFSSTTTTVQCSATTTTTWLVRPNDKRRVSGSVVKCSQQEYEYVVLTTNEGRR